jgi:hypothetical protein
MEETSGDAAQPTNSVCRFWVVWVGDFLGTGNASPQRIFLTFTKARTATRAQHFKNQKQFKQWKKIVGIPSGPDGVYADFGWSGWGDFLGTGNVFKKNFLPFTEARTLTQKQGFRNMQEFNAWRKPEGIPGSPNITYTSTSSGWTNWGDFLGNGNVSPLRKNFLSFTKARALTRKQKFKSVRAFCTWVKPEGVPCNPHFSYKASGWTNWYDFLGNKERRKP